MSNDHLKGQQAARFGSGAPTNSSTGWVSYNAEVQRRQQQEALDRQRRQQQEAMERQRQTARQRQTQSNFGVTSAGAWSGNESERDYADHDETESGALRKVLAFVIVFVSLLVMTFGGAERLFGSTDQAMVPGWYQAFAISTPFIITALVRKLIGVAAVACVALLLASAYLT